MKIDEKTSMQKIVFNKPYLTGKEIEYIASAVKSGKISGDGDFTKQCHQFFTTRYGFSTALLTTSCTDALEMAAILLNLEAEDEVICPTFTFVSTANAFVLRGAKIVFADSLPNHPNIDVSKIEALITSRTKVIVVVHYAGVAVDMDGIQALAKKYELSVVEDAAQAIESFYKGEPLGGFGEFAAFSFHETKNIMAGEGGLFVCDEKYRQRAEVIREKGTNRSSFFRGEVDKYGWVDIGSSFLPSDMIAAFLWAQLENIEVIQSRRLYVWNRYHENLKELPALTNHKVSLPYIPSYATNNAHCFYLVCGSLEERSSLISFLKSKNIHAVFHYLSLHKSPFYESRHDGRSLPEADRFADCLVRLPLYFEMTDSEIDFISQEILKFYKNRDASNND